VIDAGPDHEVMCAELDAVRDASAAVGGGTTTSVQDDGSASQRTVETDRRSATNDGVAADGASELVDLPAGGEQSDRRNVPTQPDPVGGAWPEQTTRRSDEPILEAQGVSRTFDLTESSIARLLDRERTLRAVDDVDLAVYPDETIGIVGESGSGKSTLAELLTGLQVPTEGEILFEGEPVGIVEERTADQLADVGVVFPEPPGDVSIHASGSVTRSPSRCVSGGGRRHVAAAGSANCLSWSTFPKDSRRVVHTSCRAVSSSESRSRVRSH